MTDIRMSRERLEGLRARLAEYEQRAIDARARAERFRAQASEADAECDRLRKWLAVAVVDELPEGERER